MRFSKLFAPTAKEAPKDALLPSHIFLIRGGFINQTGSGLYNFLPLGKRVLDKIKDVVKDEMDKAGAQEVSMGVVSPAELWRQSGRYNVYGKELLRFKDRKDNEFVLGPTHEEVVVDIVRNRINSYKQLPLHLYQITTKFRDEARPRFGLLRGREFVMKDGYSFHSSIEDLRLEFDLMEETYTKIFTRLGLKFRAVAADSGAIGGSGSKEFMVLTKNGEDDILVCDKCEYAANVEAAKRAKKTTQNEPPEAIFAKFHTPIGEDSSIEQLSEFFKIDTFYTIKAVIKKAVYKDKSEIVVFFIRGCDALQEIKAQNAAKALELLDVSKEDIKEAGLIAGFCGPIGLENIKFFIDNELKEEKNLICGANERDYHYVGVSMFNFKSDRYADLAAVEDGDLCPCCNGKLSLAKGIEVGHIFQLGQKYSSPMNAAFLDQNGKSQPFFMGCYGIGISRLVAVMIEANHDNKGCIWNKQTAPYMLDIIISNIKNETQTKFATKLYEDLKMEKKEIILDDRNERFGFKMNDFELIGFPYALIVGRELDEGKVELVSRVSGIKEFINTSELNERLKEVFE
ncbi:MAG: proline--tRNA ligase [Campylobacteraceae bacterium]|jgi:prolyl-tRNA synthetase|nr:proline--tRNA ligase [Campylobacteraceae bacterium]